MKNKRIIKENKKEVLKRMDEKYCMNCGTKAINTRQTKKGWYMYLCPKCKCMFIGNIESYSLKDYLKLSPNEIRDHHTYYEWDKHRDNNRYNKETQERKRKLIKETFGEELLLSLEN